MTQPLPDRSKPPVSEFNVHGRRIRFYIGSEVDEAGQFYVGVTVDGPRTGKNVAVWSGWLTDRSGHVASDEEGVDR